MSHLVPKQSIGSTLYRVFNDLVASLLSGQIILVISPDCLKQMGGPTIRRYIHHLDCLKQTVGLFSLVRCFCII